MNDTSGTSDDALPPVLLTKMGHLVVSPPQLEGEDRLEVFPFEQDSAF